MKKQEKNTLLDKNQVKKPQQKWIEMQQLRNGDSPIKGPILNENGPEYVKLEDETSQISQYEYQVIKKSNKSSNNNNRSNVNMPKQKINSGLSNNINSSYLNGSQNKASQNMGRNIQPNVNNPSYYPPQTSVNYGVNRPSQYIPSKVYNQAPYKNPYNSVYNNNYVPDVNYANNLSHRNSQMIRKSQIPVNNIPNQSYNSTLLKAQSNSAMKTSSVNRSTSRINVPQMAVNCDKCTFSQSVPGNSKLYICCMCNQMNQCFPLYGIFTCGICRANVIYPYGTSQYIKCTRCQTVNKVSGQPSQRKDNQEIVMGTQKLLKQQKIDLDELRQQALQQKRQQKLRQKIANIINKQKEQIQKQYHVDFFYQEQGSQIRKKDTFQQPQILINLSPLEKPVAQQNVFDDKPFTVFTNLANQKAKSQQILNLDEIIIKKQQKQSLRQRQTIQFNNKFQDQLIQIDTNYQMDQKKQLEKNIPEEILKLSQKLDESLYLQEKEHNLKIQHKIKQQIKKIEQKIKMQQKKNNEQKDLVVYQSHKYPSIF